MDKDVKNLLKSQNKHLLKLQDIVRQSLNDETILTENILNPPPDILTRGQRISDKVARFGGSWAFILSFFVILIIWIIYNTAIPKNDVFDPYPFILMNLILSCIAALQAPVIMMSQNRQEEKDRQRSENDYLVNMRAELEIRSLHRKLDLLQKEQIKVLIDSQAKQLELLKLLEQTINPGKTTK